MTEQEQLEKGYISVNGNSAEWRERTYMGSEEWHYLKSYFDSHPDFNLALAFDLTGPFPSSGFLEGYAYHHEDSTFSLERKGRLPKIRTTLTTYSPTQEIARERLEEVLKGAGISE
ncbi:MAG: hypothetical protein Q8P81_01680 [Nanoarchaeota archaeon]|nr:hypothetical protein [Nanoarchaeota archaeon]